MGLREKLVRMSERAGARAEVVDLNSGKAARETKEAREARIKAEFLEAGQRLEAAGQSDWGAMSAANERIRVNNIKAGRKSDSLRALDMSFGSVSRISRELVSEGKLERITIPPDGKTPMLIHFRTVPIEMQHPAGQPQPKR